MGAPAELVEDFLVTYGKNLSSGDSAALVACHSVPGQILTNDRSVCVSDPEMAAGLFDADHTARKAAGVAAIRPEHVDIDHLGDSISTADVRWRGIDADGNGTSHLEFTFFILRYDGESGIAGDPGIRVETAVMRTI